MDGDGAVLMHMGSMAVLGSTAPENMVHIVINNGAMRLWAVCLPWQPIWILSPLQKPVATLMPYPLPPTRNWTGTDRCKRERP
ncbi:MAG: hypothetical protein ACLR7F_12205 [Waltera sp.]